MKNLFILLLFFITSLSAEIIIKEDFKDRIYKKNSNYFITSEDLPLFEIKQKEFQKVNKTNFPKTPNFIWTKINLENISKKNKTLFFRNMRAGIDYIDVFIFKDDKFQKSFLLGDLREQSSKEILSRKSIFSFDFQANSQYEIYFKYKSIGVITNNWEVYSSNEFFKIETQESLIWGVIYGILFAILIYNSVTFLLTQNKAFIFYMLSVFFSTIYLTSLNGSLYKLDLGLNLYLITLNTWYGAYLYIICLLLFILYFFEDISSVFTKRVIKTLIAFQTFALIILSIGFYDNTYHYTTSKIDIFSLMSFFLIFLISIFVFRKDSQSSIYFLVGQAIYIFCFTFYTLKVIGFSEFTKYSWVILPIGLILELIFISLALSVKAKEVEKSKKELEEQLLEESRFTNAGRTISYIIHQLKSPISKLGSQINLIEATKMFKSEDLENVLDKKLPEIKSNLQYINEINKNVSSLFLNPNGKEEFDLKKQLDTLLILQDDHIKNYDINIVRNYDSFTINSFKGTISNIVMVILENAFYELKSKEEYKEIKITAKKLEKHILLSIEDNAGGIKELKEIFDISYSNKGNKGSGLGLSLAKTLVKDRLEGKIEATNTNKGAKFTILFPS